MQVTTAAKTEKRIVNQRKLFSLFAIYISVRDSTLFGQIQ